MSGGCRSKPLILIEVLWFTVDAQEGIGGRKDLQIDSCSNLKVPHFTSETSILEVSVFGD